MIDCKDLGVLEYQKAWDLQEELRALRISNKIPDTFLLVEHPPVYTMGRRDSAEDFLSSEDEIRSDGIDIIKSNRGGRITYHGPRQIVGYFIFSLHSTKKGVKDFVCAVEEVCLRTLQHFGVEGRRDPEYPGLWIGQNKIAAVGLNFVQGVSQHGFSFNVDPDLLHYRHIVPCGIAERGITSLKMQLKENTPSEEEVKKEIIKQVRAVFTEEGKKCQHK